jgi:transcriptional regulator with XRE-family HTH domain
MEDDIRKRFAKNVRSLRRAKDYPQDVFADMVGIHRTYLSAIENGRRNPSITVVAQFAKALGVTPGSLLD